MTTENELSVVAAVGINDKKTVNEKPEEKIGEQLSQKETSTKTEQEPVESQPSTVQDEQTNVEKPKRGGGGRKKRSNIQVDTNTIEIKDDGIDTQPLFEQPVVVEGKRSRKPTSRLELSELTPPKKELSIPLGRGKPLGEIEYVNYQITHASTDALSRMRSICFGRRGAQANMRKNLRAFSGFEFTRDSDEYQRVLSNLTKLKKDQLRSMSDILGLPATGRNTEHAERILDFLLEPTDEGKRVPEKKMSMRQSTSKKRSVSSKEQINTDDEDEEEEQQQPPRVENGDENEDVDEEEDDEEEEEEETEPDEDYVDETGVHVKDDPDDYGYVPGKSIKKSMKKRSPARRPSTRRAASTKRKRGTSTAQSKRASKKSKSITEENENASVTAEEPTPTEMNDESKVNKNKDTVAKTESSQQKESNNDNLRDPINKLVKENEPSSSTTTMNNGVKEMISTTS